MKNDKFPEDPGKIISLFADRPGPILRGPGSDGGGGDMEFRFKAIEDRLEKVEAKLEKVDDRLRGVETGVATLSERVAHLPSKGFIVRALLASLAIIAALITFQDQVQGFFR